MSADTGLSLAQTRGLAFGYRMEFFGQVDAVEDPEGRSTKHMAWMLDKIVNDDMTIDKASRWLGYVQAWLLLFNQITLDDLKQGVRDVRESK